MEQVVLQLLQTTIILSVIAAINLLVRLFIRRRFVGLEGHENFVRLVWLMVAGAGTAYLAAIWGLVSIIIGAVTALGALAIILSLAILPWFSDLLVGISLYVNPHIKVGSEIEIGGVRGRIVRMALTTTQISGDEAIIIVPNRKFREEIVKVISTKMMSDELQSR